MIEGAKPCPFCNKTMLTIEEADINGKMQEWVECNYPRCGAIGPAWRKTKGHVLALKYWNQRGEQ